MIVVVWLLAKSSIKSLSEIFKLTSIHSSLDFLIYLIQFPLSLFELINQDYQLKLFESISVYAQKNMKVSWFSRDGVFK